jgi:hypothetical protein
MGLDGSFGLENNSLATRSTRTVPSLLRRPARF